MLLVGACCGGVCWVAVRCCCSFVGCRWLLCVVDVRQLVVVVDVACCYWLLFVYRSSCMLLLSVVIVCCVLSLFPSLNMVCGLFVDVVCCVLFV